MLKADVINEQPVDHDDQGQIFSGENNKVVGLQESTDPVNRGQYR